MRPSATREEQVESILAEVPRGLPARTVSVMGMAASAEWRVEIELGGKWRTAYAGDTNVSALGQVHACLDFTRRYQALA